MREGIFTVRESRMEQQLILLLRTSMNITALRLRHLYGLSVNPLKPELVQITFKNSVRTSKRTPNFTITKINRLMLFKEMIAVYTDNIQDP
jgi:hypothetical protein